MTHFVILAALVYSGPVLTNMEALKPIDRVIAANSQLLDHVDSDSASVQQSIPSSIGSIFEKVGKVFNIQALEQELNQASNFELENTLNQAASISHNSPKSTKLRQDFVKAFEQVNTPLLKLRPNIRKELQERAGMIQNAYLFYQRQEDDYLKDVKNFLEPSARTELSELEEIGKEAKKGFQLARQNLLKAESDMNEALWLLESVGFDEFQQRVQTFEKLSLIYFDQYLRVSRTDIPILYRIKHIFGLD